MKRRISLSLIFMLLIGVLLSFLVLFNSAFDLYNNNVKKDLEISATSISNLVNRTDKDNLQTLFFALNFGENQAYYYVNSSGDVIYYSEIIKNSEYIYDLIDHNIYFSENPYVYYDRDSKETTLINVKGLENGDFLVVAQINDNLFSLFKNILPIYIILITIGILISYYISERAIDDFISNIEDQTRHSSYNDLNIDIKYKEVYPLLKIIRDQKEDISYHIDNLKNQSETIETIISNMKEGMILLDDNMNILLMNNAAIILSDINYKDVNFKGKNLLSLIRNIDLRKALEAADRKENNIENLEVKINDKYISAFINNVKNKDLNIGFVVILVDDTEKKELELKRREFSANVSHELKTPLTSINGYAEMIVSGIARNEDTKNFAKIILDEGKHLLKVIDDIIKISRLDENENELEVDEVDLSSILFDIINRLNAKISFNKINVNFNPKNIIYTGNKGLITELLTNLVDNAIKYNKPNGKIDIILEENINNVIIKIKDTGLGISVENQNRIFERFYTVDKSHNKKDSTGLGLSIVKHIIKLLDGEIRLKSDLGIGSEFTVILPKIRDNLK